MASLLRSEDFLEWIKAAGLVPDQTRRVVIDAEVGNVVMIYAELFGAKDLIAVSLPAPLRGAEVRVVK